MSVGDERPGDADHDHRPAGWPVATPPSSYVIGNARVVLDDRVTDPASVIIRDGLIAEVVERVLPGDLDAGGRLLLPGLIDVHSDALEKERAPRSNAVLPWDFALTSYEAKLVAAGVTTIFHGAGFQHKAARGTDRSPELALELCQAVEDHRTTRIDHRILHRFAVRSESGGALLCHRLEELPAGEVPLVSHEDHTPGQGQYADPEVLINAIVGDGGIDPAVAEERVTEILAEAARTEPVREANLAWLGDLARRGRIRLLGHDPDTAAAIDELRDRGATTAEFPTTIEAARRARDLGLTSVAGAPNVLRGRSHSGNVAAAELIKLGLIDALRLRLSAQCAAGCSDHFGPVRHGRATERGAVDHGRSGGGGRTVRPRPDRARSARRSHPGRRHRIRLAAGADHLQERGADFGQCPSAESGSDGRLNHGKSQGCPALGLHVRMTRFPT